MAESDLEQPTVPQQKTSALTVTPYMYTVTAQRPTSVNAAATGNTF